MSNKEAIVAIIDTMISTSASVEEWHYISGFLEGLRVAEAITAEEMEQYIKLLQNKVCF